MRRKVVVVTGFGPFQHHTVNASSIAVQELSKTQLGDEIGLITEEIKVSYDTVDEVIPELWEQFTPDLVIHVGVSSVAETVLVEKYAHSFGYNREDVCGCLPQEKDTCCIECLQTSLNLEELCRFCEKEKCPDEVRISEDAGRYLCEYIYYKSLKMRSGPVLFVHVPCLSHCYTKQSLAADLKAIIKGCFAQIF